MKGRVFITGATGFIGRNLVNELLSRGRNVICLIRGIGKAEDFRKSKRVHFVIGDLDNLAEARKQIKPSDVIVHLANISDGKGYRDFYRVNVEGTKKLVALCEKKRIKKFIFLSSSVVLNKFKSPYTETKRLAENIVKDSKLNYVILRPDMVYGRGSKRHIVDIIEGLKKKKIQLIFGYGGIKIRPVHVQDVVKAVISSIWDGRIQRKIYNLASEKPISYSELFSLIKKKTKSSCILLSIPQGIALFAARIYKILNKNSTIYEWIRGNEGAGQYTIANSKKDLGFSPIPIERGLDILVGAKK